MLLSRTRRKIAYHLKAFIFDSGGFQEMLELREKHQLEDSMGFRGQFDEHRRFQITFLKERGLVPTNQLLEIGCGPLTGGVPIIDYLQAGNYVGVDVRRSVLDMAWREVGKAELGVKNPRLICSSSFGSAELDGRMFDFILSFSVLYHLTDDKLNSYFKAVRSMLKSTGVCFANVNTLDDDSTWLEFPYRKRTLENYAERAAANGLEMTCLGEIKDLGFRRSEQERRNQMLSFRCK